MIKLSDIKIEIATELQVDGDLERSIIATVEKQYAKRTGTDIENAEIEEILYAVEYAAYDVAGNFNLIKQGSSLKHDLRLKELVSRNLNNLM